MHFQEMEKMAHQNVGFYKNELFLKNDICHYSSRYTQESPCNFPVYVIFNNIQVQHGLGGPSTQHRQHTPQMLSIWFGSPKKLSPLWIDSQQGRECIDSVNSARNQLSRITRAKEIKFFEQIMAKEQRGYNNTQSSGKVTPEVPGRLFFRGLTSSQKELGFLGIPFGFVPGVGISQEIRGSVDTKWRVASWDSQHLLLKDFKLRKGSVHSQVDAQGWLYRNPEGVLCWT